MWTPFVWLSEGTNSVRGHRGAQLPALPARHTAAARGVNLLAATSARVYLDTTDITEFDCVHIGDHSELNALACPQTRSEDRVMKIDHVRIGQPARDHGSAVPCSAVVATLQLGALTLVMKGEFIPPRPAGRPPGCAGTLEMQTPVASIPGLVAAGAGRPRAAQPDG
jgi:hypothetical protein